MDALGRAPLTLAAADLDRLFEALGRRGYTVVGPTARDGAIVYDEIASAADLPAGWTDRQEAGSYRLEPRDDGAVFGYAVGPHSWKRFLHPPAVRLWRAERSAEGFEVEGLDGSGREPVPAYAFLGVRPCELRAIEIQDRVFFGGGWVDPSYRERRERAFVVAVQCGAPGGTCFCASMGTGPRAESGFDLGLTEVIADGRHYFVVETGSERGAEIAAELGAPEATAPEVAAAAAVPRAAAAVMGRTLDTEGLKELLYRNLEHPRWSAIAERCLACTNCTMVCPTCFCTTVDDVSDLDGGGAERWRSWDSCFSSRFSYLHGGSVRQSVASRYRQWVTHKLATWIDQFGTSGCVGCGRCITWCPAAIDLTEEAAALRCADRGASTGGEPSMTGEVP